MILGIDPGLANTGWAVVDFNLPDNQSVSENSEYRLIECGCLRTKITDASASRLDQIYMELEGLIKKYKVEALALETLFFAKNAKSVPNAARGYKDLNLLAFRKVTPSGLVMTYSCSQNIDKKLFQQIVFSAAADAGRNVRIVRHLDQPSDHPINIFHPESEYLKGMLLWVE
jgi:Holliday junction resolvasome RuvABC endonuclease subunit